MILWHPIGTWSGRGRMQTESFPSASGSLRIDWETADETASGAGAFKLTVNSAVSGRVIREAVNQGGAGRGTVTVSDDPRQYYVVVESSDVEWKFAIFEGFTADVMPPR